MPKVSTEFTLPDGREDVPIEIEYEYYPPTRGSYHNPPEPGYLDPFILRYEETGEALELEAENAIEDAAIAAAVHHFETVVAPPPDYWPA